MVLDRQTRYPISVPWKFRLVDCSLSQAEYEQLLIRKRDI